MSLTIELVNITPKMAREWLELNTNNRHLREENAQRYAKDMRNNEWRLTHQGIAFYDDGSLADGQHRLKAITLANKSVPFLVTRGIPRTSGHMIDQNVPRMAHDAIQIAGNGKWIDRNIVAVSRTLLGDMGVNTTPRSVAEIADYAQRYEEPLQYANALCVNRKRHVTSAPIIACYVSALVGGEDRDKIKRFAAIMHNGEIAGPHENAAIRLREFLVSEGGRAWMGVSRVETARKVQRAIQLFCQGKPVTKLYAPDQFIYPTPR
jgi:hypothetical protein